MALTHKIPTLFVCLIVIGMKCMAVSTYDPSKVIQIDSLIEETTINNNLTRLDLLVLYQDALKLKPQDSVAIFKNLALLNAELNQPKDAKFYSEKYIANSLDFKVLNHSAYGEIAHTSEYISLTKRYSTQVGILDFIYFYAALIGFFLAFAINLSKRGNTLAKICIGGFIAAHSLFILEFVLYCTNLLLQYPHTYRISSSVALLFGPFLHFYYKSVSQNFKFRSVHWLHFLPALVVLGFLLPLYLESSSEKLRIMLDFTSSYGNYDVFVFFIKITSLVVYAVFIWKMHFSKLKNKDEIRQKSSVKKWFKYIFSIHVAYIVSYLLYGVFAFFVNSNISSYVIHFQIGIMTLMILYIAYMAFVQPNIFNAESGRGLNPIFALKYKKSGLTSSLSSELKDQLIRLLVDEKIYKRSDINLELLSNRLNTTRHNASQIINEHFNMNFFELINTFRIQEAINILEKDVHGNLNIIDVAYEVGYNNKVTFNKAFKKATSVTPTEYIQSRAYSNL